MKNKRVISLLWGVGIYLTGTLVPTFGESLYAEVSLAEAPVGNEQLQLARGMADVNPLLTTSLTNNADQHAVLDNNQLVSDLTGNNAVTNGAFSGASVITTLIQNTGNQVIIQQSTLVNILFQQ